MFPLKFVLVGLEDGVLPHIRREISNLAGEVEGECKRVRQLVDALRGERKLSRVVIFQVKGREGLHDLHQAASTFVGWPILALVENGRDAGGFLEANRAGAFQVVPLPLEVEDFRKALECIAIQFGFGPDQAEVWSMMGSIGGSGTTTLAMNLAYEFAQQRRQPTLLMEMALQMGVLATSLDIHPQTTLLDLLASGERLDVYMLQQSLHQAAEHLQVLTGAPGVHRLPPVEVEQVQGLIDYARRLARVVVLDLPPTFDDLSLELLMGADRIFLIGRQTVASVRSLRLLRDALPPEKVAHGLTILLNRYEPDRDGFRLEDLAKILQVDHLAVIRNDPEGATVAADQGKFLRLAAPRSPILNDLTALLDRMMPKGADTKTEGDKPKSGLFTRIVQAIRG